MTAVAVCVVVAVPSAVPSALLGHKDLAVPGSRGCVLDPRGLGVSVQPSGALRGRSLSLCLSC